MSRQASSIPASSFEQLVALAASLAEADEQMLFELIKTRKDASLTQREVAKRLGIAQPSVAKFEAHDSDPRLSTIRRYALAVGAHVEHRVHRVDDNVDPVVAWHHEPAAQPMTIEVSVAGMVRESSSVSAEDYRGYGLAS